MGAWFLVHTIISLLVGLDDEVRHADVAVVFGNQVEETGVPHPRLQSRLDRGLELYRDGIVSHLIVSGGLGEEGFEEADVMRDVMVASGVPREAIIVDRDGYTTYQTARNARRIMRARGFEKAIVVTSYYHVARARLAMTRFGIDVTGSAHARMGPEWREPFTLVREFMGFYYYLLRSYPEPEPEKEFQPQLVSTQELLEPVRNRLRKQFDGYLDDPAAYADLVREECRAFPEGDIFPFLFPVFAYTNLAVKDAAESEHARIRIAKLIDLALPSVIARVKPPGGDLRGLEDYAGHATYLGQLNLALGCYRLIGGDERYAEIHERITTVLTRALENRRGRPLESFPGLVWPFDTVPVLVSLKLSGQQSRWREHWRRHRSWIQHDGNHAQLNLPYSRISPETCRGWELPRGCDLSLRVSLLAHLDPEYAASQYKSYVEAYWLEKGLVAGFAEWPHGMTRFEDMDSGPIIMGVGMAATGLGVGATIAVGDEVRLHRLATQLAALENLLPNVMGKSNGREPGKKPLLGGMIPYDPRYLTGFLYGDAVLFYSVSWQPWNL